MPRRRGQGEGSLEELPSGKWRSIYTQGKKADGSQRKVTATFETRKEASAWLNEQLDLRRRGRLCEPSRMLLSVWLKAWLKGIAFSASKGSLAFCKKYCDRVLSPKLGDIELGELSSILISNLMLDMAENGTSPDGIKKTLNTLRQALNHAVKMKLIYSNPANDVKPPRVTVKEPQVWTAQEAQRFLEVCAEHRFYALFVLALDTGMRQGELLGLQWKDINLSEGWVDVWHSMEEVDGKLSLKEPKTARSKRRIWISSKSQKALRDHVGPQLHNSQIFLSTPRDLRYYFSVLVKKAGVPKIRFHDLRHTNASLLLQAGVGIKAVSERLGHSNVAFTLKTYVHVLPGDQYRISKVVDRLLSPVSHTDPTECDQCSGAQVNELDTSPTGYGGYDG